MEAPTKKQQAILDYMKAHSAQHSYWPSIRDIQAKFRFASTNAVFGHLQALERKGVLQRIPGAARAYKMAPEVVPDFSETIITYVGPDEEALQLHSVKMAGAIPAGFPDYTESSGVVASMQAPLPRVPAAAPRGLRLARPGRLDDRCRHPRRRHGHRRARDPKHGDIVAALIDGETTLKRLVKQGSKVYLKAENKNYPNLEPVSSLVIQGIAKQIVKPISG